ncbi:MAG: hypothetical protein ABIH90_03365 [Candidatus Aenigmatarchaeota archaeon]
MAKPEFNKKTVMSLFIIIVFGFSMASYAFLQKDNNIFKPPENPLATNHSIDRLLEASDKIYILNTGRTLIENLYNETDGKPLQILENFASKNPRFVFVEQALINGSAELKMIGAGGDIVPLEESNLTEETLFELLCEHGITVPLECTLREM